MLRKPVLTGASIVVVTGVVVLGAAGAAIAAGAFDVAATKPRSPALERLLAVARNRSIEARSQSIAVPPLDDPELLRIGAAHYQEMCVTCHGAPGLERSEIGSGLNPSPPSLHRARPGREGEKRAGNQRGAEAPATAPDQRTEQAANRLDADQTGARGESSAEPGEEIAEIYWVVKNGIWATGMPAFGPTHSDRELWGMVAFVARLPGMSPSQYAAMVRDAGAQEEVPGEDAGVRDDGAASANATDGAIDGAPDRPETEHYETVHHDHHHHHAAAPGSADHAPPSG
jgi:mono/diheme cytochrome c family protein